MLHILKKYVKKDEDKDKNDYLCDSHYNEPINKN